MTRRGSDAVAPVPRIGDPQAPRWVSRRVEARARPIVVAILSIAIITMAFAAASAFISGERPRVVGTIVGMIVVGTLFAAALVVWVLVWRKPRAALRRAVAEHPDSFVTAARLPAIALPEGEGWLNAPPVGGRMVILIVSEGAFVITDNAGAEIVKVSAADVAGIEVVEYVEQGKAYDGIAIRAVVAPGGVVLQIVELLRFRAWDVMTANLSGVIAKIEAALGEERPHQPPPSTPA